MTDFVLPPAEPTSLPIRGVDARFPIRRVFCVGRNYGLHVKEMGGDPKDQPPLFFTKPADAIMPPGEDVPYPSATKDLQHEIELVVALKGGGENLTPIQAADLVYGYAVGVDLTRRDLQGTAKKSGQPWDSGKAFDASGPVGEITPADQLSGLSGSIRLSVNGELRQNGQLNDMIWSVAEVIAEASKLWRLQAGDLIFTGTPEGVGPLVRGDRVEGAIDGVGTVSFTIT